MKLTREEALRLHRQMWTDMQTALGDDPDKPDRIFFKRDWCSKHFNFIKIEHNCFLCEYVHKNYCDDCDYCPIKWDDNYDDDCCAFSGVNYGYSPISVILALPEREADDEISDN